MQKVESIVEFLRERRAASMDSRAASLTHQKAKQYEGEATQRDHEDNEEYLGNPFQVDKERIVLCRAFRRLKHKTQVFWAPRNDLFRTRLTHTIELGQLACQIGSLLGLNTDLVEAIAYGHDIGHPPFGHAGERTLQTYIRQYCEEQDARSVDEQDPDYVRLTKPFSFGHHDWAWKILQEQEERPYKLELDPVGLNLTKAVQSGIRNPSIHNRYSLEAQVVGIADDVTWINHDADDFEQAGITLPEDVFDALRRFGATRRERILWAVADIVSTSFECGDRIVMSEELDAAISAVRHAYRALYLENTLWQRHEEGARHIITKLVDFYMENEYEEIATVIGRLIGRSATSAGVEGQMSILRRWRQEGVPRLEAVVDHIVKMTDTFALDLYRYLYSPETLNYYF